MGQKIGKWSSSEARQQYVQAYEQAFAQMPPAQSLRLETSYGEVQAYRWKGASSQQGPPILLLPGKSSGSPMWYANVADFQRKRDLYAFDALGDAGLSEQKRAIESCLDQAKWVNEAIEALDQPRLHIVGHSFGGWLAANYASFFPASVASLILIEPVFCFQMIRWIILLKSIPYNLRFLPKKWRQGLIKEISGSAEIDHSDPVSAMIDHGASHYRSKLPAPRLISKKQLQGWDFPLYLAFAEHSGVHDSRKAMAVAQEHVKHLSGKIWEDATHSLPMEHATALNQEILDFLEQQEGRGLHA